MQFLVARYNGRSATCVWCVAGPCAVNKGLYQQALFSPRGLKTRKAEQEPSHGIRETVWKQKEQKQSAAPCTGNIDPPPDG